MRTLTFGELTEVSGGAMDSSLHEHLVLGLLPEDFSRENLVGLGVFGGAVGGALAAGGMAYSSSKSLGVGSYFLSAGAGLGGCLAGAVGGGATTALFLTITMPIYNFVINRF